jgi:anti-sigma B factor antagonist
MWNPFARRASEYSRSAVAEAIAGTMAGDDAAERRRAIGEIEQLGQTAVVTLTITELTGLEGADRLCQLLDQIEESGATNLVLDVQNVQLMDSACLGALVRSFRSLEQRGGKIAVVNADRSVQYLFKLTKLDRVFPICADVMTALAAIERSCE